MIDDDYARFIGRMARLVEFGGACRDFSGDNATRTAAVIHDQLLAQAIADATHNRPRGKVVAAARFGSDEADGLYRIGLRGRGLGYRKEHGQAQQPSAKTSRPSDGLGHGTP